MATSWWFGWSSSLKLTRFWNLQKLFRVLSAWWVISSSFWSHKDVAKLFRFYMSRLTIKLTKWHVRPAKTQISLGIRPVWSESSLFAWRKLGSLATHWSHSEDADQTGWMPRLIWVFAGRTDHFVGFVMRWLICVWWPMHTTQDLLLKDPFMQIWSIYTLQEQCCQFQALRVTFQLMHRYWRFSVFFY